MSALLLESVDPGALSRLERLGWMADGVEAGESNALLALHELALESANVFAAVEARGWLRDGLSADETRAVWRLLAMSGRSFAAADEAATLCILAIPSWRRWAAPTRPP